jgi:hypothetical protein
MRLSPREPLLFQWHFFNGLADVYLAQRRHFYEGLRLAGVPEG